MALTGTTPYRAGNRWCKKAQIPNIGWIVSRTGEFQRDVAQKKLLEFLPAADIAKIGWRQNGVIDYILLKNNSHIGFKTAEMGREKFEGVRLDWAWLDEEQRRGIFHEVRARLIDRGGWLWCTMTPLTGMTWTYNDVVTNPDAWTYKVGVQPPFRKSMHVFKASTYDNPTLKKSDIDDVLKDIPDKAEQQARLYGDFTCQFGKIYQEWEPFVHVKESFHPGDIKGATAIVGIDTGRSFAAALILVTPKGYHLLVDEYYAEEGLAKDHAAAIWSMVKRWDATPTFYIDPSSQFKAEFAEHGITCYDGNAEVLDGINRVRTLLKDSKFFVLSRLERLRWEIDRYIWDEWKGENKHERDPKPRPRKKDDHMLDAVRYAVMSRTDTPPEPFDVPAPTDQDPIRKNMIKKLLDRREEESLRNTGDCWEV